VPNRRRGPGKCTYCLQEVDVLTDDHVLPRSWYTGAAENVSKPRVPACLECNNRYSAIEDRLREIFALSFAQGDARVAGIQEEALRGIDPSSTTDPREARVRRGRRDRIARESDEVKALIAKSPAGHGLIPGFGLDDQPDPAALLPLRVQRADLVDITEKIVRGLVFHLAGRLIEPPHEVQVELLKPAARERLLATIANTPGALTLALGDGFRFTAATAAADDPLAILCDLQFWGRLNVTAFVRRREDADPPPPNPKPDSR
jgi:hypothetical protein